MTIKAAYQFNIENKMDYFTPNPYPTLTGGKGNF